jgi:hypothetical protein
MAKFEFNEAKAMDTGAGEAGKKVLDSGVYDVTLNTVSEVTASTGTEGIDFNFTVDGAKYPNMVYGLWTHRADGTELFGTNIVQSLMGVLGIKKLTPYEKTIEIRDGAKKVSAYKELDGKRVKVAVQKVLDIYNGEVKEKNEIKAFFGVDTGKTYSENKSGSEAKQIKWYQDKLEDKETTEYKKWKLDAGDDEGTADDDSETEGGLL